MSCPERLQTNSVSARYARFYDVEQLSRRILPAAADDFPWHVHLVEDHKEVDALCRVEFILTVDRRRLVLMNGVSDRRRRATLLILNYNGKELLAEYLPSVVAAAEYDGAVHEVVVVDNASTDDSVGFVQQHFPTVHVRVMAENRRFFSYNEVVAEWETDSVILLNNDIRVERAFIHPLLRHFRDPRVFAAMPKVDSSKPHEQYVFRCPGRFQYGVLGTGRDRELEGPGYTLFAHGGAAAYDRAKFLQLGGFDSLYWTEYYEDIDLSYLAWTRGWTTIFEPASEVFHLARATVARVYSADQRRRQRDKVRTIFVLKNIADRGMLADFLFWTLVRVAKGVVTVDRVRLGAYWDVIGMLPRIAAARKKAQSTRNVSDKQILAVLGGEIVPSRAALFSAAARLWR